MNKRKLFILVSTSSLLLIVGVVSYFYFSNLPQSEKEIKKLAIQSQAKAKYTIYLPSYLPNGILAYSFYQDSENSSTLIRLYDREGKNKIAIIQHDKSFFNYFSTGPSVGKREQLNDITVNDFTGKTYMLNGKSALYLINSNTFVTISQSGVNEYAIDELIKIAQSLYKPI